MQKIFPEIIANEKIAENVYEMKLRGDFSAACKSDALDDSVDYGAVCHLVDATLRASTFKLIERAAQGVTWRTAC